MPQIICITLKGIFRDRIFQGIMALAVMFLFIPTVASLSMRQVTELSILLSLSLISCIQLLLAVFLGGTLVWKDIERRFAFSVLSLPISRTTYLFGRFIGVALFLLLTTAILGSVALLVIKASAGIYAPDRPLAWLTIVLAIFMDSLRYILLVAVAMMLSTVSTSFFLPIFGTISTLLAGNLLQEVHEYLMTTAAADTAPVVKGAVTFLYYLLPNLSAFDIKVNAVYSLPVSTRGILLTILYCAAYSAILLGGAALLFNRREMK
jgi:ABC-type transport system involved in multi-copper enzyme maturation permease subunit